MDVKFGKIKPSNNIFTAASAGNSGANFFASNNGSQQGNQQQKQESGQSGTRFNDLDSKILEDNAYREMPDEMFKIEHKIGLLENTIEKLNSEIEALESFGYQIQLTALKERKHKLELELEQLNEEYSGLGISAKISEHLTSAMKHSSRKKNSFFGNIKEFIFKQILMKVSKKFNSNAFMKEALESLSGINLSVDELVNLQIPYGETASRYEKLTAYLNRANVIHSQIAKNINTLNKNTKSNSTPKIKPTTPASPNTPTPKIVPQKLLNTVNTYNKKANLPTGKPAL